MPGQIYQDDPTAPPIGPPKPSYAGFGTPLTPPTSLASLIPGNQGGGLSALVPQQGNQQLASEDNPGGTISPYVTSDPGQAATLSEFYRRQSPQGALSRAVDQFQRGNDPGGEQLKTVAQAAKESRPAPDPNALKPEDILKYTATTPYDAARIKQEQARLDLDTQKAGDERTNREEMLGIAKQKLADAARNAGQPLSPDALNMLAQKFVNTGELPSFGIGNAAGEIKKEIANAGAQMAPGTNLSEQQAGYKAESGAKTANVKKYSQSVQEASSNLKMMQDAVNRINSGQSTAPGADDWLLLSRHIAMTIGGVPGARIGQDILEKHQNAVGIPDQFLRYVNTLANGAALAPGQRQEFLSLGRMRLQQEQQKLQQSQSSQVSPGGVAGGGAATPQRPTSVPSDYYFDPGTRRWKPPVR